MNFDRKRLLMEYKGRTWKHFKGNNYLVLDVVEHTETGEDLVIYKALYGSCKTYARPIDMFLSEVDKEKYPNSNFVFRFVPCELIDKTK